MSKTYNDPAKQLWRIKLREFVQKNILPYRRASSLRVACFPGAEQEGEEALEVKEIYLPLGIPAQNIVGLEREAEPAQRLRAANLGIEVVERDASDYFLRETPKEFDVISLDYKGQQTLEECLTLEYIASRQLLSHHGILATNYYGSRESESMKKLLVGRILALDSHREAMQALDKSPEDIRQNSAEIVRRLSQEARPERLRDGITAEIVNIFSGGTINRPIRKHFFSEDPHRTKVLDAVASELNEMSKEQLLNHLHEMNSFSDARNRDLLEDMHPAEQAYYRLRRAELERKLHTWMDPESARALFGILCMESQKSYLPKTLERYAYTSNTGSPMLADFFLFQPLPRRLTMAAQGILQYNPKELQLIFNPARMDYGHLLDQIFKVEIDFYRTASIRMTPRIELVPELSCGYNGEPSTRELHEPSPAEKAEIYTWLRDGSVSDAELCDTYNISSRQLGSYKAWVTMQDKKLQEAIS